MTRFASKTPSITIMLITPELAKEMLEANVKNRCISKGTVSLYSQMMTAGEWRVTNQGIGFYADGTLADGQHRLMAVIESGASVYMTVMFGIVEDAVLAIDNNRPRTLDNIISISEGRHVHYGLISSIKMACGMDSLKVDPFKISKYINNHHEWTEFVRLTYCRHIPRICNRGVCGALLSLLASGEALDDVKNFARELMADLPSSDSDGVKTVHRYAIRLRSTHANISSPEMRKIYFTTQRVYMAYKENVFLSKIYYVTEPVVPYVDINS